MRHLVSSRRRAMAATLSIIGLLSGCQSAPELPDLEQGKAIVRELPADYASIARAHNTLASSSTMLSAEAVGTLRWMELPPGGGKRVERKEQIEGRLFFGGEAMVHLAVRKLSQTLLIMACAPEDGQQAGLYFAIDVRSRPRTMRAGRMSALAAASSADTLGAMTGLARALDDALALSSVPENEGAPVAAQWSQRGQLVGITYERANRGGIKVRRWLSASDGQFRTLQSEVFSGSGAPLATTRFLSWDVPVGGTQSRPPLLPASMVMAVSGPEQLQIELRLYDLQVESSLSPRLFDAGAQAESLGVERLIDLDMPQRSQAISTAIATPILPPTKSARTTGVPAQTPPARTPPARLTPVSAPSGARNP